MKNNDQWQLLAAMPDSIIVVGNDGVIKHANASAEEMFGYTHEELVGLPLAELIPHSQRQGHAEQCAAYFSTQPARPMGTGLKFRALRKDGSELPVDIALTSSRTSEGTVAIASIRDISENAKLIAALSSSVLFNLTILKSLGDPIAILNQSGRIIAINDAWSEFAQDDAAQCPDTEGIGADYLDVCRRAATGGNEIAGQVLRGIEDVLSNRCPSFEMEYPCHSPREDRWFLLRVVTLKGDEGGAVVSRGDISTLKSAEVRARNALAEVEQLKDRLQAESRYLREEIEGDHNFEEIVGQSSSLRDATHKIEQVAGTGANVLLTGETGTGKELFARAVHNRSPRKDHPLVKINCASLPPSLIESELFGHAQGAFTGALTDRVGRFELAHEGTLFLDEIGELELDLQIKLLRVLQEGEFERIGGAGETLHVDVRVIAATNRDLLQAMNDGAFRSDLYYRLAVFPIHLPTLRQRRDDIPLLVWHFIDKKKTGLGRSIERIPDEVMQALVQYDWPGNIRELENIVERAMIISPGSVLVLDESFLTPADSNPPAPASPRLNDMERAHIQRILADCNGKIKGPNGAAAQLDMKPSTLRYRMKKLGIVRG